MIDIRMFVMAIESSVAPRIQRAAGGKLIRVEEKKMRWLSSLVAIHRGTWRFVAFLRGTLSMLSQTGIASPLPIMRSPNQLVALMLLLLIPRTAFAQSRTVQELLSSYAEQRFGMFIHYNMNTYHAGWGENRVAPTTFAPPSAVR